MEIIVTVKQVVDPNLPASFLSIDPTRRRLVAAPGLAPVMNGYDANALEAALRLRDAGGGKVTALCLGDETCRNGVVKRARAMGADNAVLLSDPVWEGLDAAGAGRVLAAGIRKLGGADLVLCGRQASDTDGGQVLFWIAEALTLPAVSPVARIEAVEGGRAIVHRLTENGTQRVAVRLPALLGISSETAEPRAPSLKGTMLATRSMPPVWRAGDLEVERPEPLVELLELMMPERESHVELMRGENDFARGAALADALHARGLA